MQVNPEDGPPEIYVTWSDPRITDFENTAMNAACVLHITWQLDHIGHVASIVFHCFQGRPHHLAQLTSLWRHDFSPDTQSATDRRSNFQTFILSII